MIKSEYFGLRQLSCRYTDFISYQYTGYYKVANVKWFLYHSLFTFQEH